MLSSYSRSSLANLCNATNVRVLRTTVGIAMTSGLPDKVEVTQYNG